PPGRHTPSRRHRPPFGLRARTSGERKGVWVSAISLPDNPSVNHLRRLARILHRKVRAGEPEALAMVAEHHPGGVPTDLSAFQLSAAQLVVARRCGFPSWPRLKRY